MVRANEQESYNGEPKKPELLPKGDNAKEIVEVLVEMYQAIHNPKDTVNHDSSEHAN